MAHDERDGLTLFTNAMCCPPECLLRGWMLHDTFQRRPEPSANLRSIRLPAEVFIVDDQR